MADKKISALTSLVQADIATATDVLPIVDTSATETKKATPAAIVGAAAAAGLTNVDINSGAIDGTTIGANSAAAGTFTNLTASGTVSFSGATVSNGGSVTTVDINGGTIDGASIGASSASSGAFTTLSASGNVTLSGGTANGVLYLNGSKVATSGSDLNFNGTNVGIGGSGDPFGRFYGRSIGLTSASGAFLEINAATGNTSGIDFGVNASRTAGITSNITETNITTLGATPLLFGINSAEQMRLTSTGLGIGTSSPAQKLHVNGANQNILLTGSYAVSQTNQMQITNGQTISGGTGYGVALQLISDSGGNYRGAIQNVAGGTSYESLSFVSGNVGIGTSSPSDKVTTTGGFRSTGATGNANVTGALLDWNSNTRLFAYSASGAGILFYTTPSGGSVNEVMRLDSSGNLGIGTSSPAKKLDVSGTIRAAVDTGSAAAIDLTYSSSTRTIHSLETGGGNARPLRILAQSLTYADDSATRLTVDTSGNLGLGVTPSAFGSAYKAFQFGTTGALYGESGDAAVYLACNAFIDSGGDKYITSDFATRYNQENGVHKWLTAPSGTAGNAISFTQAMTLDSSGNLGIGSTPSAYNASFKAFELINGWAAISSNDGTGVGNVTCNAYATSTSAWAYKSASSYRATRYSFGIDGVHAWYTSGTGTAGNTISFTQAMTLDASGNLGVGTTSPAQRLTVSGNFLISSANPDTGGIYFQATTGTNAVAMTYNNGGGNAYVGLDSSTGSRISGAAYALSIWHEGNNPIAFGTNNTRRATITAGGNLLVGATADYLSSRVLINSAGADNSTNILTLRNSSSTDYFRVRSDGYTYAQGVYDNTTGSAANVFVGSGGDLLRSTSSLRYKKDVADATHGLAEVLTLRPVTYKGKSESDGDTVFGGLIAEEVHAAGLTEFVAYDNEGQPDALHYGNMVSLLVKAIQEQQAMINELKAEVAALKGA